ncbi:DHA2 family efflux MFS transporter permease subunit [Streptomyces sp. NPDC056773]|uniref:DHA2 family efflux MFS transporter permease subunit n=1 Tax=unclassified Streptomyces TaxID=2593676 RepID=UPI0036A90A97
MPTRRRPADPGLSIQAPTAGPPPARAWWAVGVIALAELMVVLDSTIMNIALPHAQRELGFSDGRRPWIITAYALAFGSLLLLGGRLADLFGRRRVFAIGIAGFALASALGGAAPSFGWLVAARAMQGLFAALLAPAALSLLAVTFTGAKERAQAFGIYGIVAGSGAGMGLLLGGVLTEFLSWRWTMYVNVAIAAIALTGALLVVPRTTPAAKPALDVPGTLLACSGLFAVVYGLSSAEAHGWAATRCWALIVAGVLLLALFARWQTRAVEPLLPLRILRDRSRGGALLSLLLVGAGIFAIFLFLTYYLQDIRGYSPVLTGFALLPMTLGIMAAGQLATVKLVPKLGARAVLTTGFVLAALGTAWLTRIGTTTPYPTGILLPLVVAGVGLGCVLPPAMSIGTNGVDRQDAGSASAALNTMQQVGGSIGTALLNTVAASAAAAFLAVHGPSDKTAQVDAALHSYATAYWWTAGIFALGALLAALVLPSHRTTPPPR